MKTVVATLAMGTLFAQAVFKPQAWASDPTNQQNAYFGCSVAGAGDVNGDGYSDIIVGATGVDGIIAAEGRVYVYYGSKNGLAATPSWTEDPSNTNASLFGASCACAGDVNGDGFSDIIIGTPGFNANKGRVYVYYGSASGLPANPSATLDGTVGDSYFGFSVASAGDMNGDGYSDVIIGSPNPFSGIAAKGRAYVFSGGASGLSNIAAATFESSSAWFGICVASAYDINSDGFSDVVVGSDGKAFVFFGSSAAPALTIADPANQTDSHFGVSVAGIGDTNGDGFADVAVGVPSGNGSVSKEGKVYVYHGNSTGLAVQAPSTSEPADQTDSGYGNSVAFAGDINGDGFADMVVGAFQANGNVANEGRAYIFLGSSYGLATSPSAIIDTGDQSGARFGRAVACAGDVDGDGLSDMIVGSCGWDGQALDEGKAYVFYGITAALSAVPNKIANQSFQTGAYFGWSAASAGDVDGDGYSDVIVGAPAWDCDEQNTGRAYLLEGGPNGLSNNACWLVNLTEKESSELGNCVACAGDVNGDGFSDVIICAYQWDGVQKRQGKVFVLYGSADGLSATANWSANPADQENAFFGISASNAGDINGDGYSDIVVGAEGMNGQSSYEGRVYVYYGSPDGLSKNAAVILEPPDQTTQGFGGSLASAGDVNGDGFSDVVVGAYLWAGTAQAEGRAYVYLGGPMGLSLTPAWTANPTGKGQSFFGASVASAGDVNGDGFSDVIVGAYGFNAEKTYEGRAYVYYGSASGLSASPAWIADPTNNFGAGFGYSVANAGDVNGDGFSDVVIGAYGCDGEAFSEGRAYLYLGSAAGLSSVPVWKSDPTNQDNAGFGYCVACAGDVNGDGFSDVVAGALYWDGIFQDEGAVFTFYGNGATGANIVPMQTRSDGSAPVQRLGLTYSETAARVQMNVKSPGGKSAVKIQFEIKPGTSPFDCAALEETGWLPAGSVVEHVFTGLTPNMYYHWRARVRYAATASGSGTFNRWVYWGSNGALEADFRILKPPAILQQKPFSFPDLSNRNPRWLCKFSVHAPPSSNAPSCFALILALSIVAVAFRKMCQKRSYATQS